MDARQHGSVIFLDGPIGVGKTTLGHAVAQRLTCAFLDGDDYVGSSGPWYVSSLSTSRRIVTACQTALMAHRLVLVAYPLRCINWVYYSETFRRLGIACHGVSLIADIDSICNRTRTLTADEAARSAEMIAQGYGNRPFSAAQVRTDTMTFAQTQAALADRIETLLPKGDC